MRRADFHHGFYLFGVMALAMSMPLSHFVMGLSSFLLLLNWIAEWDWQNKWHRIKENRQGLWFSAFYLVYAVGLVNVTDWGAAAHEMLTKLPFLISPLIVVSSKPFSKRELQYIFSAFAMATLIGCGWNFGYAQTHELANFREMSRFIDHIRFSLCVVLSVVFCVHYALQDSQDHPLYKYIYVLVVFLLIPYLIYSQTLSGLAIMILVAVCYIVYLIWHKAKGRSKWIFASFSGLLLVLGVCYICCITWDYFHVKDPDPDYAARTESGRPYTFDDHSIVENGHRVYNWVCSEELEAAWALRSDSSYDELMAATLIRYLNSMGVRKDSAAVMRLSDDDIRNIEHKIANVHYAKNGNVRRALYETYFGLTLYQKYGLYDESSMLQRFELWRVSWHLIREHWLFGVGIGQQRAALDRQLELEKSLIAGKRKNRGSHNQFLTIWLAAGILPVIYFCFLLAYPFTATMRDRVTFVYFALILALTLSMLVEDTLNAQTGRMLFTIFVPLMLFSEQGK